MDPRRGLVHAGTRWERSAPGAVLNMLFALSLPLLSLLLPAAGSHAAAPVVAARIKPMVELSRAVWTTRNGLPHNQANAIRHTPDGYLRFATWEGVARYNGIDVRAFDRGTTPALRDNGTFVARAAAAW